MNTIIAHNNSSGGGKELTEYLIEYVGTNYKNVQFDFYISKNLTIKEFDNVALHRVTGAFEKVSLFFKRFSNVLYFGNLPPMRKMEKSGTYFHNPYYLNDFYEIIKSNSSIIKKLKYLLLQMYFRLFNGNSANVYCQTPYIKRGLERKYNVSNCKLFPLYRGGTKFNGSKKYDFIYVSIARTHKNHKKLLEACLLLAQKQVSFSIALTIQKEETELLSIIDEINAIGTVTIVNYGIVPKSEIFTLYNLSKALIFPSLMESFGLPLLEAAKAELDILGADLPYMYEVVEPSLAFNPYDVTDMAQKMEIYLTKSVSPTKLKVQNFINEMCKDVFEL